LKIQEFDFDLPPEQVAQRPLERRDASRLMVLDRQSGQINHHFFRELPTLLRESDLLVVNETRVIAARLVGNRLGSGGKVEFLLVRPIGSQSTSAAVRTEAVDHDWICLAKSRKPLRQGAKVELGGWVAEVLKEPDQGAYAIRFMAPRAQPLASLLERVGRVPLPPYIRRESDAEDRSRYQTVYATTLGSVAAPTAGLHFTQELFADLERRGIQRVAVSLDVGPGTFLPVRAENLEEHRMHSERYFVSEEAATALWEAKSRGRRVVAVGTTVVRALESAVDLQTGKLKAGANETELFIRPGFRFRIVDALLTNFHLPKSTLIVLVSAFCGKELTLGAYREAVASGYRFFSYGDAMLIS
jgi:S-adenosylmethionine:tRNA ribosyltransferase-isomerase